MLALRTEVISYLDFLLLLIQPVKYIDFQLFPEIESIRFQARSSLKPFLRRTVQGVYHIPCLVGDGLIQSKIHPTECSYEKMIHG